MLFASNNLLHQVMPSSIVASCQHRFAGIAASNRINSACRQVPVF
jgi:hypothetical protein